MGRFLVVFIGMLMSFASLSAESLLVATASNFNPVLQSVKGLFEQQHPGSELRIVSGSSGKFFAQIQHGAPFDIFLSADDDKTRRLVELGLAEEKSEFTYAYGSLVLWSNDPDLLDGSASHLNTLKFNKLALANSKLAPYGLAAEEVLARLSLAQETRAKWVQAENVAQAYQFIFSGNAELGFVAQSQVWQMGKLVSGSMWLIPTELYSPIKQNGVILRASKQKQLATQFMQFLISDQIQAMIVAQGYQAVSGIQSEN